LKFGTLKKKERLFISGLKFGTLKKKERLFISGSTNLNLKRSGTKHIDLSEKISKHSMCFSTQINIFSSRSFQVKIVPDLFRFKSVADLFRHKFVADLFRF
jgi:hypothetical protein